jgi:hypothetical protein
MLEEEDKQFKLVNRIEKYIDTCNMKMLLGDGNNLKGSSLLYMSYASF